MTGGNRVIVNWVLEVSELGVLGRAWSEGLRHRGLRDGRGLGWSLGKAGFRGLWSPGLRCEDLVARAVGVCEGACAGWNWGSVRASGFEFLDSRCLI
jgi:hypothetical protein